MWHNPNYTAMPAIYIFHLLRFYLVYLSSSEVLFGFVHF
ncbi:hypothetical protein LC613_32290 [Nostoc sphaeroides CHAB 2801]|nr:hypothetical protein [Nostoc sphaeroides CHAB 2801]